MIKPEHLFNTQWQQQQQKDLSEERYFNQLCHRKRKHLCVADFNVADWQYEVWGSLELFNFWHLWIDLLSHSNCSEWKFLKSVYSIQFVLKQHALDTTSQLWTTFRSFQCFEDVFGKSGFTNQSGLKYKRHWVLSIKTHAKKNKK